jgi:hypothetical protein
MPGIQTCRATFLYPILFATRMCLNMFSFYLTPVRMTTIKYTNNKCWQGCGGKGTIIHCWWEGKLVQPLWKTVWRFLKKLKLELLYDPAIPPQGIYPKECKSGYNKSTCTAMFYCSIIHNNEVMETAKMPHYCEWMKKMWYFIQWNLFSHKEK